MTGAFDIAEEVARRRAGYAPRPVFDFGFCRNIQITLWPHADLPPGGILGNTVHDAHRPYFRDEAGRRWLLDGSGDVA